MLHSKKHQVQAGDNLTHIARKFGLPSWQSIYNSPENLQLRQKRGSPDNLQIGDMLSIPPNPIHILEYKIERLQRIKLESTKMFDQMLQEAEQNYRKIKNYGNNIDEYFNQEKL